MYKLTATTKREINWSTAYGNKVDGCVGVKHFARTDFDEFFIMSEHVHVVVLQSRKRLTQDQVNERTSAIETYLRSME